MNILNDVEEELLKIILENKKEDSMVSEGEFDLFPGYININLEKLFNSLEEHGYIAEGNKWVHLWNVTLNPAAISYKEDEKKYLEKENLNKQKKIYNLFGDNINFVEGNLYNSTLSISNSFIELERDIEERELKDEKELKELLQEVKEYIKNIEESKSLKKNNTLFKKLGNHFERHNWFYSAIVKILGEATLMIMSGK